VLGPADRPRERLNKEFRCRAVQAGGSGNGETGARYRPVAEGSFGPTPTAFYDLFRVDNGKIVEHWDVTPEIATDLPHNNGLF